MDDLAALAGAVCGKACGAGFGLPLLRAVVRRRAVYRAAALDGVSVFQMGARGQAAADEIQAIIEELPAS